MRAAADAETRKIPAADSRRRSRVVVTTALAVALVLLIVPALAVRPVRDPAALGFPLGFAIGLGLDCLRHVSNARGQERPPSPAYRYLTARTWTGSRTIDVRDIRSVRARRVAGRFGSTTYVVVLDGEGARMSFSDKKDIEQIRRAVTRQLARRDAPPVRVSRLAAATLGLRPLPPLLSALWSLGSVEATLLAALTATFTIIAIASLKDRSRRPWMTGRPLAAILARHGGRKTAIAILGELALFPDSTLATEHLAKATLAALAGTRDSVLGADKEE